MANYLPSLWGRSDPFSMLRRELEPVWSDLGRRFPGMSEVGAKLPAVNVAETKEAFEVTAELPGVEEKDISVSLDGNRLIIAGEKRHQQETKDKEWHVVESSFGSFQRAVALPFEPKAEAVEANFDKGVLHLTVKKPDGTVPGKTTIAIKSGQKAETKAA